MYLTIKVPETDSYPPFPMIPKEFFLFAMLVFVLLGVWIPGESYGFAILEPESSPTYHSGQTITVKLELGEVAGISAVHYFWYGQHEDMLEEQIDKKLAMVATGSNVPPFGGKIKIPRTAIGPMRLLAVAKGEGDQLALGNWAIFDEIVLQIEPKAQLREIDFETEKPLRLGRAGGSRVYDQVDFLGKTLELPVVGRFSDGITRQIRSKKTGTFYRSSDESIITINEDGLFRLVGNGKVMITARNRGKEAILDVRVQVNNEPNEAPVPDPGEEKVVSSGTRVTLNGLNSYDPEGGSLGYHWSQVLGSKVALLDPYSAKASFLAPNVLEERLFRFKLRVTDIRGADSNPVFVDIIVEP